MGRRVRGLCVALRTGLHFAPPGINFLYSNPGISNLKEILHKESAIVKKSGDRSLCAFLSPDLGDLIGPGIPTGNNLASLE